MSVLLSFHLESEKLGMKMVLYNYGVGLLLVGQLQINRTEDRPVLHYALRAPRSVKIMCDGKDVVPDVWEVLDKIRSFSDQVRLGSWVNMISWLRPTLAQHV